MIDPAEMDETVSRYVSHGDRRQPLASPLYAELAGLPPLLIRAGGAAVLYDYTVRMTDAARRAGVGVEFARAKQQSPEPANQQSTK